MKLSRFIPKVSVLAVCLVCLVFAAVMMAQVKTETTTTPGQPTTESKVERGEVVYVSGNNVLVKMENGELRLVENVPESARVTVDGKELSVHELQPGMKLERTITTTTTPKTVKTVKTVTGKVFQVSPPTSVILTLEDGTNQKFTIPKGQKFNIEGQETDAFGLKKGMKISATKIVEAPETEVAEQRKVVGHVPAPPTEQIQGPLLVESPPAKPAEVAQAEPAQAPPAPTAPPQGEQAEKKMPQTAGDLPVIGLIGAVVLLSGLGLLVARGRRRIFQ